ncbi:MAG: hypothetical protein ACREWG_01845, partial [Gammaproteobacteria bacterium]
ASQMKALGIGVTTSVGIGGDPINGSSFKDLLEVFEEDPETKAVVIIGEIGGPQEAEAAHFARDHATRNTRVGMGMRVLGNLEAYFAGRPPGDRVA